MYLRKIFRRAARQRRWMAALSFGVMLSLFLGLTALSVDLGVVAVARSQRSVATLPQCPGGLPGGARSTTDGVPPQPTRRKLTCMYNV